MKITIEYRGDIKEVDVDINQVREGKVAIAFFKGLNDWDTIDVPELVFEQPIVMFHRDADNIWGVRE